MRFKKRFIRHLISFGLSLVISEAVLAGKESMPSMPLIQAKRVFTIQGNEDLESQMGFGDQEPVVRMMNLMMVEGSGMEGMQMGGMEMGKNQNSAHEHTSPRIAADPVSKEDPYDYVLKDLKPKVGVNILEITIKNKKDKNPVKGLKLKAQVYMTSMDMGTDEPKIKETAPGTYQLKASFAMKGPWAVKLIFPDAKEKVFDFDVSGMSH